jgi:hypothetical protein
MCLVWLRYLCIEFFLFLFGGISSDNIYRRIPALRITVTHVFTRSRNLKGAGTLVDVLQLSYSFHQNWSKLGTAITEDHKN